MRFIENGPSVPEPLLLALDQGRVVFFCGAGVSLAKANLPNFFTLANKVIDRLGVGIESPIRKILSEAKSLEAKTGVAGLISADRIFGLLEREFSVEDIESAVSIELMPSKSPDLSAHKTLLDLATSKDGKVRIVTTNFDLLFESAAPDVKSLEPANFMIGNRITQLDGVVYLHGKVDHAYKKSSGDGFILSSSDFGRAYLSDGWATSFIREILKKYVVVFIGYSADDPPVQYLLEALNKSGLQKSDVYAFQEGTKAYATERWMHKGVQAIEYEPNDNHRALWDTLSEWAIRAKDPDKWCEDLIEKARVGPELLRPHERGQIAHLISSIHGIKKFSEGEIVPPAQWICVFDPAKRYALPGYSGGYSNRGNWIDPFDQFCLDSDIPPEEIGPSDTNPKRNVPEGAWSAFSINHIDRMSLTNSNISEFNKRFSYATLPPRIAQLGVWFTKVAEQLPALWWAVQQGPVHWQIQRLIKQRFENSAPVDLEVRKAWRYLLEYWQQTNVDLNELQISSITENEGWSAGISRQYAELLRPYIEVAPALGIDQGPPKDPNMVSVSDLISIKVAYPHLLEDLIVPNDWLGVVVPALRQEIEIGYRMELEIGNQRRYIDLTDDANDIKIGISSHLKYYIQLYEQWINSNPANALQEFNSWPTNLHVFTYLRLWAVRVSDFISNISAEQLFRSLSDEDFWKYDLEPLLLEAIEARWSSISRATRLEIENRIIKGPERFNEEEDDSFKSRAAFAILKRLEWMAHRKLEFVSDVTIEIDRFKKTLPDWIPEYAESISDRTKFRSGWVRTDRQFDQLLSVPIFKLLEKAKEMTGRGDDFLIERNPFAGLVDKKPIKALAALTSASGAHEFPDWAWNIFLFSEARKNDKQRLTRVISAKLLLNKDDDLKKIIHAITHWFSMITNEFIENNEKLYERFCERLIEIISNNPNIGNTTLSNQRIISDRDWIMEAINSPSGKIAEAVLKGAKDEALQENQASIWWVLVEKMLTSPMNVGRYSLIIFISHLNWFYEKAEKWSEEHLIGSLDGDIDTRRAAWAGFLWGGGQLTPKLFARLKDKIFNALVNDTLAGYESERKVAGIVLSAWINYRKSTDPLLTSPEFRELLMKVDEAFRERVLWTLRHLSSKSSDHEIYIDWENEVTDFLKEVWPRQKSIRSGKISLGLSELLLSKPKNFSQNARLVIPLLTEASLRQFSAFGLTGDNSEIVELYPYEVLHILSILLPSSTDYWPYQIEKLLSRLTDAKPELSQDPKYIELKRKWDSR
ncbi:MAG: hypothetical protein B0W54_12720 [Cellvibrio sp. 79]|nr:MAG: hypothetical protein B0W54_12720 [Cellvibrio sp. 79]